MRLNCESIGEISKPNDWDVYVMLVSSKEPKRERAYCYWAFQDITIVSLSAEKWFRQQQLVTSKAQEKRQSNGAKKNERKIKSNYCYHALNKYFRALNDCFHMLNIYNGIEALSEFRSGFLCWTITVSLINNFRKWSNLAKTMGLLKQTVWFGLSVKCRVAFVSCGVLEDESWLLIRVIRFRHVWPI